MRKSRRCYASALGDCGGATLTREHYFSRAVLELLVPQKIGGFHWLKPGHAQPSIASLTARILCEKHHQQLSSLDEAAVQVYRFFDKHVRSVVFGERDQCPVVEVKGELLERWILKTLIGLMASGNVLNEGERVDGYEPVRDDLEILFGCAPMRTHLRHGLYLDPRSGEPGLTERSLRFQPWFTDNRVSCATCHINGILFGLLISGERSHDKHPLRNSYYRPPGVQVINRARPSSSAELRLTWAEPGSHIGQRIWWVPPRMQDN